MDVNALPLLIKVSTSPRLGDVISMRLLWRRLSEGPMSCCRDGCSGVLDILDSNLSTCVPSDSYPGTMPRNRAIGPQNLQLQMATPSHRV